MSVATIMNGGRPITKSKANQKDTPEGVLFCGAYAIRDYVEWRRHLWLQLDGLTLGRPRSLLAWCQFCFHQFYRFGHNTPSHARR